LKTNFKFWKLSISLIFVRSTDAYLTYTITPDLSFEANPLVLIGEQGWPTLLFVNILVVFISILLLYFSIYFPPDSYPSEKNYSFKEFVSHFLYNDKTSFHKIYFFVPYNKKTILSFCGFLFPRVFISWSIIIIIHNIGVLSSSIYRHYIFYWNLWFYIYIVLAPITFYYFWKYFKEEYKKYNLSNIEN
jgi:hypothetical protein